MSRPDIIAANRFAVSRGLPSHIGEPGVALAHVEELAQPRPVYQSPVVRRGDAPRPGHGVATPSALGAAPLRVRRRLSYNARTLETDEALRESLKTRESERMGTNSLTYTSTRESRPHIAVRGIYGGVPTAWFERGQTLADYGVNAVWIASGNLRTEDIALLKQQGAQVYAEFNTLRDAGYLKGHPEAAPVGADGRVCPPPDGWQGVCPTHPSYRRSRMEAFRAVLRNFAIDGIWLDYHHSHASWERAVPNMPDTCFCARCLAEFSRDKGITLPEEPVSELSERLLGELREAWSAWRTCVFTAWVREFREIVDGERPKALLGTFHCPWNARDHDGALRSKLAIDLKAQASYLDVFSTMPYHARFGHAADPAWISRQTAWLGQHLGVRGEPEEANRIWPIVQLSDWGERVPPAQVETVLDHGTRLPATGVTIFDWDGLHSGGEKEQAVGRFYRAIREESGA
jgi:hypothetical protein